ncbi:MAG: DUF4738 domain-containing protein [Prevotella sp.]|nr:DUF4738 domain-containing protein [Prevotella sp.]
MKKQIYIFLLAAAMIDCTHGSATQASEESREAKQLLQGIWIEEETGNISFRVKGDTIYYNDSTSMPTYFKIVGDSMVLGSGTAYGIIKQSPNLFWFANQNGDVIKLQKSVDPIDATAFVHDQPKILTYTHQVKSDSVVIYNGERYHWYIAINPTKYKVVKRTYNDDGLEVVNVYYDNIMHISVFHGAQQIYSSDFRKQQYASQVPAEFLQNAILGDMQFSHIDAQGLHFNATLCIPDGASCYIVESLVTYTGRMTLKPLEY